MRNSTWQATETELWNQLMYPPRRKLTLHSIPKTAAGKRKAVLNQIDKQQQKERADAWHNLRLFLEH